MEETNRCLRLEETRARVHDEQMQRLLSGGGYQDERLFTWTQVKDVFGQEVGWRLWQDAVQLQRVNLLPAVGSVVTLRVAGHVV